MEQVKQNSNVEMSSCALFVNKHLKLLEIERDAEIEESRSLQENSSLKDLQKKGLCISKLRIANVSAGLFGRILVKFVPAYSSPSLPAHTITPGDIVGIFNVNSDGKIDISSSGVVCRVHENYVTVALEKDSDISDVESCEVANLIKLSNDVTYKRLKKILKTLEAKSENIPLVDVLFGNRSPSVLEYLSLDNLDFCNSNLNETQKDAVKFAMLQKEVAIIHGPPGTGKTTTLVECIMQAVSQKLKVIACAPSNVAVDNLVEKLAKYKINIVRLGHPARLLPDIVKYSLDAIVSQYDGSDVINDIHMEINKLKVKMEKVKGLARKSLWAENKSLLKELKARQKLVVKQVLSNAQVVLSTLTTASEDGPLKQVEKDHFDICFIDECSQALEMACWIPLVFVKKCVLAGDHNQLPPTIISEKAAKEGLSLTLMERLIKLHGESIKKMLTLQYRMHNDIMEWPSKELYDNKLVAHESVKAHLLTDLPNTESNENTDIPLLLIDTAGCNLYETQAEDEESKANEGEADLVSVHVENLIKSGLNGQDIAVITPYNSQVDALKSRISGKYPKLEIKSVDGFQGREKEAVILSLVRSNDSKEIGFLSDNRRINVAITRAKRHLAVICNSDTVSNSSFLKSFIDYCGEKEVRSAFQYEEQIGHYPIAIKKKEKSANAKKSRPNSSKKNASTSVSSQKSSKNFEQPEEDIIRSTLKMNEYEEIIKQFIEGRENLYAFPPALSAFDRRIIHEIAENFGLIHESKDEGTSRYIELKKRNDQSLNSDSKAAKSDNAELKSGDISFDQKLNSNRDKETSQQKKVYCDTAKRQNTNSPEEIAIPHASNNQAKMQKTHKKVLNNSNLKPLKLKECTNANSEDEFENLIQQVVKADKTCRFSSCKKSVAIISQTCTFCKGRFCFGHFIPEAHGCGDAAKAQARSQIRKDGKLFAGSGRPEKKTNQIKETHLKKKLNEKLSDMANKRKVKTKS